jgi:hypothetical protein
MRIQSTDEIRSVLNDLDFPASKEQVVEHMRDRDLPPVEEELREE